MRLLSRLQTVMLFPMARTVVELQSRVQQVKSLGKAPICHFEQPYSGQPIMLLALYQKASLRPDLMRMLRAAKAQGIYVLAVNTLKLNQPEAMKDLADCYIERPNFGRDFGSYQTGFLHLFNRDWHKTCPRLLLINDSVYYSTRGLDKFLQDMMRTQVEVLGATENYEIEYHLGSFCISMSQNVLNAPPFEKYWKNYKLTDVRPLVIKRGEMKLSKTLKRCVSNPSQLSYARKLVTA
ncbi:lipopolysaccharide biosynthesis protein [Roseovarius sp. MBR-51]